MSQSVLVRAGMLMEFKAGRGRAVRLPGKSSIIKRVRTLAGVNRYKKPIGSIIMGDTHLTAMFSHGTVHYDGYPASFDRIERVDTKARSAKAAMTGEKFDLGFNSHTGKWTAFHADTDDVYFEAETEDKLFLGLNEQWGGGDFRQTGRDGGRASEFDSLTRPARRNVEEIAMNAGGFGNQISDDGWDDPASQELMTILYSYDGDGEGNTYGTGLDEVELYGALDKWQEDHPIRRSGTPISDEGKRVRTLHQYADQVQADIVSSLPSLKLSRMDSAKLQKFVTEHAKRKDTLKSTPRPVKLKEVREGMWIRLPERRGKQGTDWWRVRATHVHSSARHTFIVDQGPGTNRAQLGQVINREKIEAVDTPPPVLTAAPSVPEAPKTVAPAAPKKKGPEPAIVEIYPGKPARDFRDPNMDEEEAAQTANAYAESMGFRLGEADVENYELWIGPDGTRYDFGWDDPQYKGGTDKIIVTHEGEWTVLAQGDTWQEAFWDFLVWDAQQRLQGKNVPRPGQPGYARKHRVKPEEVSTIPSGPLMTDEPKKGKDTEVIPATPVTVDNLEKLEADLKERDAIKKRGLETARFELGERRGLTPSQAREFAAGTWPSVAAYKKAKQTERRSGPTQAELKNPIAPVGTAKPASTAPSVVATDRWSQGDGVGVSMYLAIKKALGEKNIKNLNNLDRNTRVATSHGDVPAAFERLDNDLKLAGITEDQEPRKALHAWYQRTFRPIGVSTTPEVTSTSVSAAAGDSELMSMFGPDAQALLRKVQLPPSATRVADLKLTPKQKKEYDALDNQAKLDYLSRREDPRSPLGHDEALFLAKGNVAPKDEAGEGTGAPIVSADEVSAALREELSAFVAQSVRPEVDEQTRIDKARNAGTALAEYQEMLRNEASVQATASRMRARAKQGHITQAEAAELIRVAGEPEAQRDLVVSNIAGANGVTMDPEKAGDFVTFDPKKHAALDPELRPADGGRAQIVTPGFTLTEHRERFHPKGQQAPLIHEKPVVWSVDDKEAEILGRERAVSATQPPEKPVTPSPATPSPSEPVSEAQEAVNAATRKATRDRHAEISRAKGTAEMLAEVDQLLDLEADHSVFMERFADEGFIGPESVWPNADPAVFALLKDAVEVGDTEGIRSAVIAGSTMGGIRAIGRAGDRVRFNPDTMESIADSDIPPGTAVVITRRGAKMKGVSTPLAKAKVWQGAGVELPPENPETPVRLLTAAGLLKVQDATAKRPRPIPQRMLQGQKLTVGQFDLLGQAIQVGDNGVTPYSAGRQLDSLVIRGFMEETGPNRYVITAEGRKAHAKRAKQIAKANDLTGRRVDAPLYDFPQDHPETEEESVSQAAMEVQAVTNPSSFLIESAKTVFRGDEALMNYLKRIAANIRTGEWTVQHARDIIRARGVRTNEPRLIAVADSLASAINLKYAWDAAAQPYDLDYAEHEYKLLSQGVLEFKGAEEAKHSGVMVALIPTVFDATMMAVEHGEHPADLHVTMLFLGKADKFDGFMRERIVQSVRNACIGLNTIEGRSFSASVFNPKGKEPCVVVGVGGKELAVAREVIERNLKDDVMVTPPPDAHEPWVPHITLIYTDNPNHWLIDAEMRTDRPVIFDRVRVAFGDDDVVDIPLGTYRPPPLQARLDMMMAQRPARPISSLAEGNDYADTERWGRYTVPSEKKDVVRDLAYWAARGYTHTGEEIRRRPRTEAAAGKPSTDRIGAGMPKGGTPKAGVVKGGKKGDLTQVGELVKTGIGTPSGSRRKVYLNDPNLPPEIIDAIRSMYEGRHGEFESKVSWDVSTITFGRAGAYMTITGTVHHDREEHGVGSWQNDIDLAAMSVFVTSIDIDEEYQGQRFGDAFYAQAERELAAHGFVEQFMTANGEVGGYAWAMRGWTWRPETAGTAFRTMVDRLDALLDAGDPNLQRDNKNNEWYSVQQQEFSPIKLTPEERMQILVWRDTFRNAVKSGDMRGVPTPMEIAEFGMDDRTYPRFTEFGREFESWIGKDIMLGATYGASYRLTGSPTVEDKSGTGRNDWCDRVAKLYDHEERYWRPGDSYLKKVGNKSDKLNMLSADVFTPARGTPFVPDDPMEVKGRLRRVRKEALKFWQDRGYQNVGDIIGQTSDPKKRRSAKMKYELGKLLPTRGPRGQLKLPSMVQSTGAPEGYNEHWDIESTQWKPPYSIAQEEGGYHILKRGQSVGVFPTFDEAQEELAIVLDKRAIRQAQRGREFKAATPQEEWAEFKAGKRRFIRKLTKWWRNAGYTREGQEIVRKPAKKVTGRELSKRRLKWETDELNRQSEIRARYGLSPTASAEEVGEAIRRSMRSTNKRPSRPPLGSYKPRMKKDIVDPDEVSEFEYPDPANQKAWEHELEAILAFRGYDPEATIKQFEEVNGGPFHVDWEGEYEDWFEDPEGFVDFILETIMGEQVDRAMMEGFEDQFKAITPGGRVGDPSSRNVSPKKNWVEKAGGMPRYMRFVRNALMRKGMPIGRATATAVNTIKKWARGGGNVSPKVHAAAVKALAEWEAKKATKSDWFSIMEQKGVIRHARDMAYWAQRGYSQGQRLGTRGDVAKPLPKRKRAPAKRVTPKTYAAAKLGDDATQTRAVSGAVRQTREQLKEQVKQRIIDAQTFRDEKGETMGGGMGAVTRLITFEDGSKAVHKVNETLEEARAEYLFGRTGEAVEAPTPAVIFDESDTEGKSIWMSYIDGTSTRKWLSQELNKSMSQYTHPDDPEKRVYGSRGAIMLGLLDVLALNRDRHGGNSIVDQTDQAWGIDHGETFRYFGLKAKDERGKEIMLPDFSDALTRTRTNSSRFARYFVRYGGHYIDSGGVVRPIPQGGVPLDALASPVTVYRPNPLTQTEAAAIEEALIELLPEFRTMRRGYWHEDMMLRWEEIRKRAVGENPETIRSSW